jgi:hypothetical protein
VNVAEDEIFTYLSEQLRRGFLDNQTLVDLDDTERRFLIAKGYGPTGFRVPDPDAFAETISRIVEVHFYSANSLGEQEIQVAVSAHLVALGIKDAKIRVRPQPHPNDIRSLAQTIDKDWAVAMNSLFLATRIALDPVRASRTPEFTELVNTFSFESQDAVTNLAFVSTSRLEQSGYPLQPGFMSDPQTVLINAARFAAVSSSLRNRYKTDPLKSLLRLYEHGYWPFGVVKTLFMRSFVVFSPREF